MKSGSLEDSESDFNADLLPKQHDASHLYDVISTKDEATIDGYENKVTIHNDFNGNLNSSDWMNSWPIREDDLDILMDCFPPEVTDLVTSCSADQSFKRFCAM